MNHDMQSRRAVGIPSELLSIDERCKLWARVTKDRPRREASAIYRAMRLYGGHQPEKQKDDPEPLLPMTQEEIADAWRIEAAWRRLILPHKNMLFLWYFADVRNVSVVAKVLRCRLIEVQWRINAALASLRNVAKLLDDRKQH